jgi:hypothetical protein
VPNAAATLTEAELAAARTIPQIADIVAACSNPERAAAALEWATTESLKYDPSAANATFGIALTVRASVDAQALSLPAGFWIDALDMIINTLAGVAVELEPRVDETFQRLAATRLARVVSTLKLPVSHHVAVPSGGHIHSVIAFGSNTEIAIDVSAGLRNRANPGNRALERLESYGPKSVTVVRVHVSVGSGHMIVSSTAPRVVSTTLDDFSWIVARSLKDPDDVFFFFRELLEHPNIGQLMALETINAFEYWRDNDKVFLTQGAAYDFVLIPFHRGDAEWIEAARLADLERALLALGLSNTAAWDLVDFDDDIGRAMLGYLPNGPTWYVRLIPELAVGIHCFDGKTDAGSRGLLLNLAEAILWRLEHSPDAQAIIKRTLGNGRPAKFWFEPTAVDESPPVIRPLGINGDRLILGWDSRLQKYCEAENSDVELVIGRSIADGLIGDADDRTLFMAAWTAAPAGFRMDAERLPVGQEVLPNPETIPVAARSEAGRELAIRIKTAGVTPGTYAGKPASDLESKTLAPTLFAMLAESISQFDGAALLDVAVTELEYANCDAYVKGRKRSWNRRFPVLGYDPIARTVEEREVDVKLAKAIRLIVEELVNSPPTGTRSPDRIDWRRLLAIADLCSEAVIRSEQNHYGLTPVATTVSEQYEITQKPIGPPLIDIGAFHRAQAQDRRHVGQKLSESDLKDIADSMEREMGFRPETVGMVLATIGSWKTTRASPSPTSTIDELVATCASALARIDPPLLAKSGPPESSVG